MIRLHAVSWFVAVGLIASGVAASAAVALNAGNAGPKDCIAWSTEAKMDAYGYDHFVNLESKCAAAMTCEIKTSTNPQPTRATVQPGHNQRVLIWRGSPARELSAEVTCEVAR